MTEELMISDKLTSRLKKYIIASVIGNGLEWYDFIIFGYFAPIFSKQFFPAESTLASLINIFIVFAVGFISRPVGAYFFGKLADQHGRKQALIFSVLLMGLSTSLMGVLPTYDAIGIQAPLLLTFLRILQGISLGGEFTSSLTFIIEHSPPSKRGFVGSWLYSGGFFGSMLGTAVATITTLLTTAEQLQSWGWRIPFILGFAVTFLGYYLRNKMEETPQFLELKKLKAISKNPVRNVLKENLYEIFLVIGILLPNTVWCYLLFVFLPNYLTQIMQWSFTLSLIINFIPLGLVLILLPFGGALSDKYGRKKVIFSGMAISTCLAPLAFQALAQENLMQLIILQVLIAIALSLSYAPTAALMVEVFPTRWRNSGMAIAYNITTGVFGGLTPLILTAMISFSEGMIWPMVWVMCTGLVGIASLSQLTETYELANLRQ